MIDDFDISELGMADYPYEGGVFFTYETDMSKPLDERKPEEVVVLETDFDCQRSAKLHSATALGADYTIYWPLEKNPEAQGSWDKFMPIPVQRGMRFRGVANGVLVAGEVEIVRPSQLGGASADIKVLSESVY